MTRKTRLLGGATIVASFMILANGPSFAQSGGDTGPQYSTPEEHQQTEDLNGRYINGTDQSPAALNGDPDMQGAPSRSEVQYDTREQRYQAELRNYRAAKAQYQAEHQEYDQPQPYSDADPN